MRNAAAAEWILSLVSDNSASTVGDLMEEAPSRGALWFWFSVLRTACSHFWRDLSAAPLKMMGLAFWGLILMGFFSAASLVPMVVVSKYWHPPDWQLLLLNISICAAASFLAGRGVANRSDGKELPAAFAVVALRAAGYALELYNSAFRERRIGPYPSINFAFAVLCVQTLFVLLGATVYRLRILAARKEASQRWSRYLGS